jgi:hypothetical protein
VKYVISLILGWIFGAAIFVAGFYFNPFVGQATLSPLAVSDVEMSNLSYSVVVADSILFTNNGESISRPHPNKVSELWEPAIKDSQVLVTSFTDSRGMPAGIGIKMSSPSEESRLFNSEILVDSIWHLYIPGRGTLAIYQTESYWAYLRDIVIPAWRSSSDSWRGSWSRNMSVGPGALGTARVTGLGGEFDGLQSEAVESLNARAYSVLQGPVSMSGMLSIAISEESALLEEVISAE